MSKFFTPADVGQAFRIVKDKEHSFAMGSIVTCLYLHDKSYAEMTGTHFRTGKETHQMIKFNEVEKEETIHG